MPPRRSSHLKHVQLQHSSVMESMETRLKRLLPLDDVGQTEASTPVASESDGTQAASSSGIYRPAPASIQGQTLQRYATSGGARPPMLSRHSTISARGYWWRSYHRTESRSRAWHIRHPFWSLGVFSSGSFWGGLPTIDVLPITVQIILVIGAIFKHGGYRSFANYMAAIKGEHIESGRQWTQLLMHTSGWVTRNVVLGIGPARQSCSFTFSKLCKLPRVLAPHVRNQPQQPVHCTLLSIIFLLREVEASTAVAAAWIFDDEAMGLTLTRGQKILDVLVWLGKCLLPVSRGSRTPRMAKGKRPLHVGSSNSVFPTTTGKHASKTAVVDTFEALGGIMGQQLHDPSGVRLFGDHTPRVTGAQVLAAAGIEVNKMRILARHLGEAILRYVAEASLRSLRADLGLGSRPGDGAQGLPRDPWLGGGAGPHLGSNFFKACKTSFPTCAQRLGVGICFWLPGVVGEPLSLEPSVFRSRRLWLDMFLFEFLFS